MTIDRHVFDALLGLGFGGYFFYKGIGLWRFKRGIENMPLSKISAVAMGDAELAGEVKAVKTLKAPFSGKDCVYCYYTVEVPKKNGWRTVDRGWKQCIFYLDDGTGQILVNPEGSEFHGAQSYQNTSTGGTFNEPGIAAWINTRQDKSFFGSLSTMGRHRFTEYGIFPGQRIFVGGAVSRAKHLVNGVSQEENIVVPRSSGSFVLSTYSEEGLLSNLGWKAPLQIFGGMALVLGCLWYIVVQLQLERFVR